MLLVQLFSVHKSCPAAHRFGGTGYGSDVFTARKSLPSTVDSGVHRSKCIGHGFQIACKLVTGAF